MRFALLLSVAFLSFSACGPAKRVCSTATCSGCCDNAGECQLGVTPLACGSGQYDATANVGQGGPSVNIKYVPLTSSSPIPTTFPSTHSTYSNLGFNYYLVGF